jgi:hypothetical protein
MVPVLPKHLADRACKLSLLGTVFSLGFSLYRVLWGKYLPTLTLSGSSLFGYVSCPDEHVDLILRFFLHEETKCVEHACNLFVAVYTWSQGLFPFDVLCVASHISDAFKE